MKRKRDLTDCNSSTNNEYHEAVMEEMTVHLSDLEPCDIQTVSERDGESSPDRRMINPTKIKLNFYGDEMD